jgi:hypothetical protein
MINTISRFLASHEMPEGMVRSLEHAIRKNLEDAGHRIDIYFFQAPKKPGERVAFYGWRIGIIGEKNLEKINECSPVEWEHVDDSILKVKTGQQLILTVGNLQYIYTWNDVEWELTAVDNGEKEWVECMEPKSLDRKFIQLHGSSLAADIICGVCHCPWCDPTIHPSSVDEYTFRKS